jgi:hypothetical protein
MNNLIQQLYNREWLSIIIRRAKTKPLATTILAAIINSVINFALAAHFHTWSPTATSRGLSTDLSGLVFYSLVQPAIFGYFCWLQLSGQRLFGQLANEGVFKSETGVRKVLVTCRDRLQSKWIPWISGLLSLAFFVWQIVVYTRYPANLAWISSHPLIVWLRSPADALVFYALIIMLYDLVVIFIALNDLLRSQLVQVRPFHPDNAGGMGAIGRFVANLSYCIAAIGIALSLAIIQEPDSIVDMSNFAAIIMFAFYLLLAPTIFFVPLWSTHLAMIAYRDRLIKETSEEFDIAFDEMRTRRSERSNRTKFLLRRIQELDEERKLLNRFPTWPFNSQNIRKFFGVALSPLMPVITSIVLDLVSKFV